MNTLVNNQTTNNPLNSTLNDILPTWNPHMDFTFPLLFTLCLQIYNTSRCGGLVTRPVRVIAVGGDGASSWEFVAASRG